MNPLHKNYTVRLLTLLLIIFLAGCTVGPRYSSPKLADGASMPWKRDANLPLSLSPSGGVGIVPAPQQDKWWEVFGDDTLNMLIEKALVSSPNVRIALYRVSESRALMGVSASYMYPVLTVDPNGNRNQLSANRPNQFGTNILTKTTLNTFTVPVNLNYELDIWGKFRLAINSSKAMMEASEADLRVIKLGLASEIAVNYFTIRILDIQADIFARALEYRRENQALVTAQYTAGLNTLLDVSQAEIETATVESQFTDTRRQRELTENALALLCGEPANGFMVYPKAAIPQTPVIPADVPASLLERRPDIVSAERQLRSYNAQVGIAQTAFLPTLKITGSAGYLSGYYERMFNEKSTTWLIGGGMSFPIFSGNRNKENKNAAEARLVQAEENYKIKILSAIREVQDAMVNLEKRAIQSVSQKKAVESSKKAAEVSRQLYKSGLTGYVNVVLADRSVLDAENNLLSTEGQRLLYTVYLIKALGGGWK